MPKEKKVLLFIVEGPTEETALALIFQRIFADCSVKFDVVHGDVTTAYCASAPREVIRKRVIDHVSRQDYKWADLSQVVQIADTDGAFVPDSAVVESSDGCLSYRECEIVTPNPAKIIDRNARKGRALSQLQSTSELTYRGKPIPFHVYYFSRNMEHALHGITDDVSDDQKELLARRFQKQYRDDLTAFRDFLTNEVGIEGTYNETWAFEKTGTNSLKRGSNLHLALPKE